MIHRMKLQDDPFRKIQEGTKTIELRLNDPKRQKVKVGDCIEFTHLEDKTRKFQVKVLGLHQFDTFAELFQAFSPVAMGYNEGEMPKAEDMEQYYSKEEQAKYGVLGIEIELRDPQEVRLETIGMYLCRVLRHKPQEAGIQLDEHGWADLSDLLAGINETMELAKTAPVTMQELLYIVATDDKQRYSFDKIRANQGHSVPVDVELEQKLPPKVLWHGTGRKYVEGIDQTGLIPKSRLYVHLSGDLETALTVGARHGEPVVYEVDTERMQSDGYVFYLSVNGVWLTESVPSQYLRKLTPDGIQ